MSRFTLGDAMQLAEVLGNWPAREAGEPLGSAESSRIVDLCIEVFRDREFAEVFRWASRTFNDEVFGDPDPLGDGFECAEPGDLDEDGRPTAAACFAALRRTALDRVLEMEARESFVRRVQRLCGVLRGCIIKIVRDADDIRVRALEGIDELMSGGRGEVLAHPLGPDGDSTAEWKVEASMEGGPSLLIRASDDQRSLSLRQDGGRSEGGSMVAIRLDTREVVAIRGNVLDAGQLAGDTEMSDAPCLFVEREQLRAALLGLAEDCLAATNESDGSSDWKQLDEVIHLYARMISDEDHRGQRRRLLQDARLAPSSREALERVSWMGGAP